MIAKSSITLAVLFANVKFSGLPNTPVQYAMLQGLQDGQNFLLKIGYERKLSTVIDMTISYEGRKTGEAGIVHTGNAQVSALF